jgi:transposase
VVPRRRVVERTLAWLGRCRRLSKDYEYPSACSEKRRQPHHGHAPCASPHKTSPLTGFSDALFVH